MGQWGNIMKEKFCFRARNVKFAKTIKRYENSKRFQF